MDGHVTKWDMCTDILGLGAHLNEGNPIRVALLRELYSVETLNRAALAAIVESNKPLKAMNGWEELDQFQELQIEIINFKSKIFEIRDATSRSKYCNCILRRDLDDYN